MINFNDEKYKPNLLIKIGDYISRVGWAYKIGDFKQVYNQIKGDLIISIYRWRYKHCKKFRERTNANAEKQGNFVKALLECFISGDINMESFENNLSEEVKAQFREIKEQSFQKTIKEHNITDKILIQELKE